MKPLFVLVVCITSLLAGSLAQDAADTKKMATVAGTVVKEPGSQPLKKVLLHLIAEDQNSGGNYTTESDGDGRFLFENVEPARYSLLLEKTGFHPVNAHGRSSESVALTLHAGQELTDLLFQMLPSAVISGRVVDGDGEALAGYGVTLLRKRPGRDRAPAVAGQERTNDLGEYRFSGLIAGQYLIAVVPPPDVRNFMHTKDQPQKADKAEKPNLGFLTTYYPGTTDFTQASSVALSPGEEMPVNFSLIPSRCYRIKGLVTGVPANQKTMVQLLSKGLASGLNGADVAADGQFEVRCVAPGSYSLLAFTGADGLTLTAREPVSVVAADVEGVKLTPVHSFNVSGLLRFDAPLRKPLKHATVYLKGADEATSSSVGTRTAQVDLYGSFQWTDLQAGTYTVHFSGDTDPDVFVKYVRVAAANNDGSFALNGPGTVEVVVSPAGGRIDGTVMDGDKPVAGVTVVAVPEEKYRSLEKRFGTASTDQNGHFTLHALPPGSYTLFAWTDLDDEEYLDEGFLKSQEANGVNVKVESGSRQNVALKLSTVGEDWR